MLVDNLGFSCNINSRQPCVMYWQCTACPTGNHSLLAQSYNAIRFGGFFTQKQYKLLGPRSLSCLSELYIPCLNANNPSKNIALWNCAISELQGLSNRAGRHTSSLAFPRPPTPTNTASSIVLDINSTVLLVIAFYCIR